jgi:hypothetical protein
MSKLKTLIEMRLQCLKGLALAKATRASNMQCFHFGKERAGSNRKGEAIRICDFTLHVQCAWRLIEQKGIIVGQHDMYLPATNHTHSSADFDWEEPGANRCDQRIAELFDANKCDLTVIEIEADTAGTLRLMMQGGIRLEIFPDSSAEEEHWRFFQPGTGNPHLVIEGQAAVL